MAETSITRISLDLHRSGMQQIVRCKKGDTNRVLEIHLSDGIRVWPVPPDALAVMTGKKPDLTSLYNTCDIREGVVYYQFTEQTSSCVGITDMELRIYNGENRLITTASFSLEVSDTVYTAQDAAKSQDEQTALDDLVNRTLDVKNATEALQKEVQSKLDQGEFNGESAYEIAVRLGFQGTEQQWMDSLRYDHSEEFTVLADQVRQDLTEAQSAAQAAGQAASRAGSAETAAVQASKAAGSSAEAAQSAQTASAEAARLSGESAQAAADSASGAQQSASAAAASAGAANGSAQNASDDAQRAKTAAAAAEDSADFAQASREAAADSESNAAKASGVALSHSEAAAGSAAAAKADAAAAVQAAQTATSQAGNAKSEADRAKQEADRAVESAGKSVSYEPQSLTPEQQKQARENISVPSNTEAVEAFCPPFEKTGPIVTCNPVTRIPYPIHVVSKIAPKQEGSGDPSPENVRPIVATDKVELVRCGKNFIDFFAKVYSDYDQLFDGFTKTINGLTVKINKGIAYISGKSTSDGWTNVINTSFNRTPTLPAGTYTLPSGLQLNLYSVSAHKLFQVTGSFTVKEPYNVDLVYIPVEKGSSPKFTKIPLSLAVGMTPAPYTPYTGETFTAQLPPDTVLLDWSEWRYKTSDGAWNDMEGQVPDIKPLPGENNLYSDTGDTTVSGREDPLHTITAMAKRITDLENHIEPLK